MACSKLQEIANATRPQMLAQNSYGEFNEYSTVHPNATQEQGNGDPNNIRGKGTGITFDFSNGGNTYDINGISSLYGSGRRGIYLVNEYNPHNPYNCQG